MTLRYPITSDDYLRLAAEDALERMRATPAMAAIIQRIAAVSGWQYALSTVKAWEGK